MFKPRVTKVLKEIKLTKRAEGDKITTIHPNELGIEAPQFSCWKVSLQCGVEITFTSNRADKTSITVSDKVLPRFVKLPTLKKPTKVYVVAVERLF